MLQIILNNLWQTKISTLSELYVSKIKGAREGITKRIREFDLSNQNVSEQKNKR